MRAQRLQRALERVGRVGVIDEDGGMIRVLGAVRAHALQATGHLRGVRDHFARHLDDVSGGGLYPVDPVARERTLQVESVASALMDLGWDVVIGPLFQTPEEAAADARKEGVDIVAASSLAAGHLTLVPELKRALGNEGAANARIIVGGVIPPQDFDALYASGATAIFPPGTVIADSAVKMLELLGDDDGARTAAE